MYSNYYIFVICTVISNIKNFLRQGSRWTIDLVIEININISKYTLLAGSSYIKLPKELNHSTKGFINILNIQIMNDTLNGVWSDIYIPKIVIQQEIERFIIERIIWRWIWF